MGIFGEFGGFTFAPIKRRWNDNVNWPSVESIWEGRDDENLGRKTALMTRYTIVGAGFCTLWDLCLHTYPDPGIPRALARIKYWSFPIVGSGLAYTTIVNVSANVRGKNDQYNHLFGGFAAGAAIGKAARCVVTGSVIGIGFGLLAVIIKDSKMHNWSFFKPYKYIRQEGNSMSHYYDFTYTKERPGYWVRKPEDAPALRERGQI